MRVQWALAGTQRQPDLPETPQVDRADVMYSLVASCRLCGIDPFAYLHDILTQISTHPASRIVELLPRNGNPSHPQAASAPVPQQGLPDEQTVPPPIYSVGRLPQYRLLPDF